MKHICVTFLTTLVIAATALAPAASAQLPDPDYPGFDFVGISIYDYHQMTSAPAKTVDPVGNVAVIRGAYASFARGDVNGVLSILDDYIAWTEAEGFPYGGTYTGPGSVATNVFARIGADWEGFEARPTRFIAQDKYVVVLGEYHGTFRTTGRSVTTPFAHVWEFAGSRIISFRQFTDGPPWQRAIAIGEE